MASYGALLPQVISLALRVGICLRWESLGNLQHFLSMDLFLGRHVAVQIPPKYVVDFECSDFPEKLSLAFPCALDGMFQPYPFPRHLWVVSLACGIFEKCHPLLWPELWVRWNRVHCGLADTFTLFVGSNQRPSWGHHTSDLWKLWYNK